MYIGLDLAVLLNVVEVDITSLEEVLNKLIVDIAAIEELVLVAVDLSGLQLTEQLHSSLMNLFLCFVLFLDFRFDSTTESKVGTLMGPALWSASASKELLMLMLSVTAVLMSTSFTRFIAGV